MVTVTPLGVRSSRRVQTVLLNRRCDRRLRDVEVHGRLADAAGLGRGDEIANLFQ
jgi:hypothetical protein